jgi:hypothetical protein
MSNDPSHAMQQYVIHPTHDRRRHRQVELHFNAYRRQVLGGK